ncbi:MAG: LysE family translocator [Akkermansiaceae bacterium]
MSVVGEWLAFAGIMAIGQFSPGPDMVLLTRTSLASGRKSGCWTAVGIACGLAFHAAVAVTGIAVVLGRGGWIVHVLKWCAAAYLVWLASQFIHSGLKAKQLALEKAKVIDDSAFSSWKRGLLCNLLNPKVAVFLAGVTAPFLVVADVPDNWPMILWLTIVIEGLVLWCAWVFILQSPIIRERYLRAAHWFDLAFGLVLILLAALLVWSAGL